MLTRLQHLPAQRVVRVEEQTLQTERLSALLYCNLASHLMAAYLSKRG